VTTAVFVIDSLLADPEICTAMVTVAEAPLAMFPKLQVTVPTWPATGAVQAAPPDYSARNEKEVAIVTNNDWGGDINVSTPVIAQLR
jgi:hypothetical protein